MIIVVSEAIDVGNAHVYPTAIYVGYCANPQ